MNALSDFLVATASYFGLPDGVVVEGSTVDASSGDLEVVLRVQLKPDDLVGIGKRMAVLMTQKAVDDAQAAKVGAEVAGPSNEALRAAWQALGPSERSGFGSFAKFKAEWQPGGETAQVYCAHLTQQQRDTAGPPDEKGRYAIPVADLTEGQRIEYAPRGLA